LLNFLDFRTLVQNDVHDLFRQQVQCASYAVAFYIAACV
jgi:hypothetical protein